MDNMAQRVIAAVSDVFFIAKVNDVLKKMDMELKLANSLEDTLAKVKTPTALIIVDLNDRVIPAIALVQALKANTELAQIPVLGFCSHVQADLMEQAKAAGVEGVVPRSVFAARLPELVASLALPAA